MRAADEILAQAKQLSHEGPHGPWLDAAGSVRSDFTDLSTDKYQHVAAASLHGRDEA